MRLKSRKDYTLLVLSVVTVLSAVITPLQARCTVSCPTCPCFTQAPYDFTIPENLPIGSTITTFTASDPDSTNLDYSITTNMFSIDTVTGVLTVATELDYETNALFRFRVEASDGSGRGLADVTISLSNVNEFAPQCAASVLYVTITEGDVGDEFSLPSCTDGDQLNNPRFSYEIVSGNEDNDFNINRINGNVSTTRALDYEQHRLYELVVIVCDENCNSSSLNYTVNAVVVVEPINEFPPTFTSVQFIFMVSESAEISTTIGRVTASDNDEGHDGMLMFTIESDEPHATFVIDSLLGDVILTRSLDFETVSSYQFTVVATDSSHIEAFRLSSSASVVVMVQDENDNRPVFARPVYSALVGEDATIGDEIVTCTCTDFDSGDNRNVEYSILQGNIGSKYGIDPLTGVLLLADTLDYDDESQTRHFELTVECREVNPPRESAEAVVVIEVTGTDEFYPDPGFDYQASVSEDMASGSSILQVVGRDRDQGPGGLLHYSLNVLPPCPENVYIDSITGVVYLLSPFDYEQAPYNTMPVVCTVTVSDSIHSAEADVIISVVNLNDVPPVCDPSVYVVNVLENSQIGFDILTLSCTDSDSSSLEYSIYNSSTLPFHTSTTGIISVAEQLDYETHTSYDIQVEVSDGDFFTSTAIHISVVGVNEYPPVFTNDTYECNIVENSQVGAVVCRVTAVDGDSGDDGRIQYQIANSSQISKFGIDETSGQIYLTGNIDYEVERDCWFVVTASNIGNTPLSGSARVHVQVIDVNDNRPQIDSYLFFTVLEGAPPGSVVSTVDCHDADGGSNSAVHVQLTSEFLVYPNGTEVSTSGGVFSIDSQSRHLILNGAVDYENIQWYKLSVVCRDEGTPVHATFGWITIQVLPVNEYAPQFSDSSFQLTVNELSTIGTSLMTFSTTDQDRGEDGEIRYSISPSGSIPFAIDQESGVLRVYVSLNCASSRGYNFTVLARDGGSPSLQANATVTVNVVNCHLGVLVPSRNVYIEEISENTPTGTLVFTVTCNSDRPFIPGASLPAYEILQDDFDIFQIDSATGDVTVRNSPDYESQSSHLIRIQCYDPHNIDIATEFSAYISISPQNEHTPLFSDTSYTVSVYEATAVGTSIAQVQATDADQGKDGEIVYYMEENEYFLLNSLTGEIFLATSLDRESLDETTHTVYARDNPTIPNSVPQSSSTEVTILVLDSNDHWPVCERTVYHLIVSPHTPQSSTLLESLHCTDADLGANSELEYSISDESITVFAVDRTGGQLVLLNSLDPTDSLTYHIPITVHDLGFPSLSISVLVVIDIQEPPLPDRVPGDEEEHLSFVEAEGLKNSVTITLTDFSKILWDEQMDSQSNFQDAIARSVTHYCALLPEACSLISGCAEFFGHTSSGRRKRSTSTTNYISFSQPSIVTLPTITEVESTLQESSSDTVSLQVQFYVKLPESASRSPNRETNYVVPRATLSRIVEQDEEVIGAVVRDSVSPYLTVEQVDVWQVTGSVFLTATAILLSVAVVAVIVAVLWKFKQKQSNKIKVVPINSSNNSSGTTNVRNMSRTEGPSAGTRRPNKRESLPHHFNFMKRNSNTSTSTTGRDSDTSPLGDDLSDVSEISLEGASMENNASSKDSQLSQDRRISSDFEDSIKFQKRTRGRQFLEECSDDYLDTFPFSSSPARKPLKRVALPMWSLSYNKPNS